MADVHSKEVRSYNMSMIKGKNTKPEIMVRHFLFHHGFRYRINVARLPGRPDIVLSRYKTVIFVNGCFWHGHEGCPKFVLPKNNAEWWENKILANKQRDQKNYVLLKDAGWKVIEVWECQLHKSVRETTLSNIISILSEK